jgi:hypothetical protein
MGPIFVHSLWRSGSTYIWNRFRAVEDAQAYYEPLQEVLGVATRDELAILSPQIWASRHPRLDKGYYAEYLPLVGGHGVPGFRKEFSLDHYFADDETLSVERDYIDLLMNQAQQLGRAAVLACCRTLGRAPWLKKQYGGTHILVVRDPAQQWYSGHLRKIEAGNAYFEIMPFQIFGKATWEPARRIARLFGIANYGASSFYMEHEWYFSQFGGAEFERSYAVFHALLGLSIQRALPVADIVIDIDRLSFDQPYRQGISDQIAAATGLRVTFDDAHVARHELPHSPAEFARIARSMNIAVADATTGDPGAGTEPRSA